MSVNSISVVSASVYVSWIYLRFFQVHAEYDFTFTIGDESDHFRFVTFFPPILHPLVGKVSDIMYGIFNCSARRAASHNAANASPAPGIMNSLDSTLSGAPFLYRGWNSPAWSSPSPRPPAPLVPGSSIGESNEDAQAQVVKQQLLTPSS